MCLYTYAHALKMYTSYESLHVHVLLIEDLYTCTVPVCVLTLNVCAFVWKKILMIDRDSEVADTLGQIELPIHYARSI